MKYEVSFSKEFKKFLHKHPQIQAKTIESFEIIATDPYHNSLDIKKLSNKPNHYRLRISKYRFLYEILESEILIYAYKADSRGDVYK